MNFMQRIPSPPSEEPSSPQTGLHRLRNIIRTALSALGVMNPDYANIDVAKALTADDWQEKLQAFRLGFWWKTQNVKTGDHDLDAAHESSGITLTFTPVFHPDDPRKNDRAFLTQLGEGLAAKIKRITRSQTLARDDGSVAVYIPAFPEKDVIRDEAAQYVPSEYLASEVQSAAQHIAEKLGLQKMDMTKETAADRVKALRA